MILTSRNLPKHSAWRSAFTLIELIVVVALLYLAYTAFAEGWFMKAWDSIADMWYWCGWFGKLIMCSFPFGIIGLGLMFEKYGDDGGAGACLAGPSILLLLYYGCIDKGTSYEKLNVRNGITYKINSNKPYSGKAFMEITKADEERENEDEIKAGSRFEFTFRKGVLHGNQVAYYSSGQKLYKAYSNAGTSWAQGYGPLLRRDSLEWSWRSPNVKRLEELAKKLETKRDIFRWTMWYENGQKQWEAEIIDGNGVETSWHENGEIEEEINIVEYKEQDKQEFNERGGPSVTLYADDLKGQDLAEYVRNHKPEYAYGSVRVLRNDDSLLEEAEFIDVFPVKRRIRYYANGKIERSLTKLFTNIEHEGYMENGTRSYQIHQSLSDGKYTYGNTFGEFLEPRERVKDGNGILTIYWSKDSKRERIKFVDGEIAMRERWDKTGNQVK